MKVHTDGNTGTKNFVFVKDGKIQSSMPLDREYNHDRCAHELGFIASQSNETGNGNETGMKLGNETGTGTLRKKSPFKKIRISQTIISYKNCSVQ